MQLNVRAPGKFEPTGRESITLLPAYIIATWPKKKKKKLH